MGRLRHLLLVSAAPRSTRRHDAHYFVASSEDGVVKYFDARQDKKAVFTLQAPPPRTHPTPPGPPSAARSLPSSLTL